MQKIKKSKDCVEKNSLNLPYVSDITASNDTNIFKNRVVKATSNSFTVDIDSGLLACKARKNAINENDAILTNVNVASMKFSESKNAANVLTGDFVDLEKFENEWVISKIYKRSNSLIRPKVANIDQIVIVVAPLPKPDLFLIDKLVVNAGMQGIDIILCVNKCDLKENIAAVIKEQYSSVAQKTICTSALGGDISELKKVLAGKLSCIAGQSAVGKSSLINSLTKSNLQKTDNLSAKINRGKNTTTQSEIIKVSSKTFILDTPGFSMLDIHHIMPDNLESFYQDFEIARDNCKFKPCSHTNEPNCGVKEFVDKNLIDKNRYDRYVQIYQKLKQNFSTRHK